jgi:hypothetical protein
VSVKKGGSQSTTWQKGGRGGADKSK